MHLETKQYLTLYLFIFLALFLLIVGITGPNKIVGNAITELKELACNYAEEGGTCFTQLEKLGLITPEECCQEVGKCCSPSPPGGGSGGSGSEGGNTSGGTPEEDTPEEEDALDEYYTRKYEINYIYDPNFLSGFSLPEGYEIIHPLFNVRCIAPTDLILNIPTNYKDAKILSCRGEQCYTKIVIKKTTTQLGDIEINVTKETEEFRPKLIELRAEEIRLTINSFQDIIQSGGAEFYGEFFDSLTKKLYEGKNIEEELAIIGGPYSFQKDEIKEPLNLPFTLNKNIHGEAIGLFAKKDGKWVSISSNIDKDSSSVLADTETISQFADQNNNINLAVMAPVIYPLNATLRRVYNPEEPSRDAVILVHGLATKKEAFKYLIEDIRQTKQPFQAWLFLYSSDRYIDEIANDLSDEIEKNIDKYDRIFIVAHSMGGIIAQQAMYSAYKDGYSYTDKVKKAILISTPNEGSVVAEAYTYLFSTLVHKAIGIHEIFKINEKFVSDLIKGRIVPRVPGVKYYVIAGTRKYQEGLIGMISDKIDPSIKSDGVVSTKSAQNIGGEYVNDMCKNYWEVDMTHMELVDDYVSRQIIGKVISEEVSKTKKEITHLGKNKYYKIRIEECSPDIYYIAIGKKITQQPIEATGCNCGDTYCGVGENLFNCPSDCAILFSPRNKKTLPLIIVIVALLIVIIGLCLWKKPIRIFSKK